MGVEDGTDIAQKLLAKSEASFQKTIEDWEKKQLKAQEIADKFYKDQKDELKTNYIDELVSDLNGLETEAYDAGKNIAENVTKGIVDGGGYQSQGQGEDIHSPSREFEEIGDYSVDGYIKPWKGRAADVDWETL